MHTTLSEQTTRPKTILDWVRWGEARLEEADVFFGQGTDNAFDEALFLVLHVLGLSYDLSDQGMQRAVPQSAFPALEEIFRQRIEERIPGAYLANKAWFCGLEFYVNQDVLIPRSPIAELILQQCSPWLKAESVSNILDLCTGSGCIGIAAAYSFPEAKVDLADISAAALAVAKRNCLDHQLEGRVQLFQSDLFNQLPDRKYDLILTNPPYVSQEEMDVLPPEYGHEPSLGLVSAQSGIDIIIRILRDAGRFLNTDGIIIAEVGASQPVLESRFPEIPFLWLELEYGGEGVFLLTADQLQQFHLQLLESE